MKNRRLTSLISCIVMLATARGASAQTVTVQQPIVDVFSVNTVVSVPDQGSVLLGGVSRAADARFNSAFAPVGSSLGLERSHGSVSAGVYIHDFQALDAELLATPVPAAKVAASSRNPLAGQAYRALTRKSASAWSPTVASAVPAAAPAVKPIAGRSPSQFSTSWSSAAAASSRETNSSESPAANLAPR